MGKRPLPLPGGPARAAHATFELLEGRQLFSAASVAIAAEYAATAHETDAYGTNVQSLLGQSTSSIVAVPGVAGAYEQTYHDNGVILYCPAAGAHVVYGAIGAEYSHLSAETDANGHNVQVALGLPTGDETGISGVAGGRTNAFQNGAIEWSSSTGAHVVYGAIGAFYEGLGGPNGSLGLQTTDEAGPADGRVTEYQHGALIWSAAKGAFQVDVATANEFLATAKETDANGDNVQSVLGYATGGEEPIPNVAGGYETPFSSGDAIYCSTTTGAHVLTGAICAKYNAVNGPAVLGLPTNDEATTPDGAGRYVHFESVNGANVGAIDWTNTTGAHDVHGQVAAEFKKEGWEKIGEATTDEIDIVGGTYFGAYNRFATEKAVTVEGQKVDWPLKLSAVNWTNQNGGSLTGGTSYTDIDQGQSNTCWIAASLAAIELSGVDLSNLITYEGNNEYDVSLYNWNNPAARPSGGLHAETEVVSFNSTTYGSDMNFSPATPSQSWALILQRAVIQAVHDWDPSQTVQNPHSGGAGDAQAILTGQVWDPALSNLTPGTTVSQQQQSELELDLSKGYNVVLNTVPSGAETLDSFHDYAVVSANSQGVTLYNPWGTANASQNPGGTDPFTVSWTVIEHDTGTFFADPNGLEALQ